MQHAARLIFIGRLQPASFAEFIHHRARRLSLDAEVHAIGPERADVTVVGEPDLVDAFEMALSLGPIDCLVLDAYRQGEPRTSAVAAQVVEKSA